MQMTNSEIAASYRLAADPKKQIGILADLNDCTRTEIVDALRKEGIKLSGNYNAKKVETPKAAMQQPETPEGNARKAERPMDRVALEDMIDIFIDALDGFREPPDGVDLSDTAKLTLAYMSGAADAFKALHGPIIR